MKYIYLSLKDLKYLSFLLLFFKEENTTLRVLDLQWNHIRKESAAALCKCLSVGYVFRPCQRHHLSQCRVAYHIKLIFQMIFINKKKNIMVNFVKFSKRKVLVFGQRDLKSSCFIMGLRLH